MKRVRGYLVDLKYVTDEKLYVHLICRNESGQIFTMRDYYRPYFYILARNNISMVELQTKIAKLTINDEKVVTGTEITPKKLNCTQQDLIKVYVKKPEYIAELCNTITSWSMTIAIFEDDLSLTRRYLFDKKIVPFNLFEAEVSEDPTKGTQLIRFLHTNISSTEPSIMAVSCAHLEDEENAPLSAISYTTASGTTTISWKHTTSKSTKIVSSEEELLQTFKRVVIDKRPDVILFEQPSFGLKEIIERARKYKIHMNINIDGTEPFINKSSGRIRTIGINEVFISRVINNFVSLSIADKELKDAYTFITNTAHFLSMTEESEDEAIMHIIRKKTEINFQAFSSLCTSLFELFNLVGLRIADLLNLSVTSIIEWIIIKRCIQEGHIVPNRPRNEETNQPQTPNIMDTVPGLYENIVKLSLLHLYPQIILKHNISPDIISCEQPKSEGILPLIIEDTSGRIERITTAMTKTSSIHLERRKNILLQIHKGIYKYITSSYSRLHSNELTGLVHSHAREEINCLILQINKTDTVIYGNYEELFISIDGTLPEFKKRLNDNIPDSKNLDLITQYPCGIFLPRDDPQLERKRYALLTADNNIEQYNILKKTYPKYIQEILTQVTTELLNQAPKQKIINKVKEAILEIALHKVTNEKLILQTKLTKRIDDYADNTVQKTLITQAEENGNEIERGNKIHYIIEEGEGPFMNRATPKTNSATYDANYYIKFILLPAIKPLLNIANITMQDLQDEKNQVHLDAFMK